MREVIVLGSTGSIGRQTLEVISSRRKQFDVVGLAAGGSNVDQLAAQIIEFSPKVVAIADPEAIAPVKAALSAKTQGVLAEQFADLRFLIGPQAPGELAAKTCDLVLNAITGAAGLVPTLKALNAGNRLALANKESLVIGGRLVTQAAAPGQLIAVDSEHSAFAQALRAGRQNEVRRLILTASGGPFRGRTRAELAEVTPKQAMGHPTWQMGRVISINSATLVNKGLELLEAGLLYEVDLDQIVPVVHPQSVVHSMVEFIDGSTIAQLSPPDMKLPIGLALNWPQRLADCSAPCDWTTTSCLTFEPLDSTVFPAVELARKAGKISGTAPAVYNAANEACVDAFCQSKLPFLRIVEVIEQVLTKHIAGDSFVPEESLTLAAVLEADAWARTKAQEMF